MAVDVLMAYPNHKILHIYTGASNYRMGAVTIQQNWPVTYWSSKLTELQHNYNTGEGTHLYCYGNQRCNQNAPWFCTFPIY